MLQPALATLIAATDSRLESFSGGFRNHRTRVDSGDLVLLIAIVAVVLGILWLVARWSERRVRSDSSLELFWSLAKIHEVAWSDRWLLWKIARAQGLVEPALLFLDPRFTSPAALDHFAAYQLARIRALRRRFFLGIDRTVEDLAEELLPEADRGRKRRSSAKDVLNGPANELPPVTPSGNLMEILGAIQALKLQDQIVERREPSGRPRDDQSPPRVRTAEFPASDAPLLDLYPWLSNDWEINNADEQV